MAKLFTDALEDVLNNQLQKTENGALGFRTTGKELLDLNFAVASLRSMTEDYIIEKFVKAYYEDKILAVKWLFFARDVREGLGERRLFRVAFKWLCENDISMARALLRYTPFYGRWDDIFCAYETSLKMDVIQLIRAQLMEDKMDKAKGKPVSLLAKWLPSENASSAKSKALACSIRKHMKLSSKEYRKMLSSLRTYIDVVECKMSANKWAEINYETVPSKANLLYKNAFMKHDPVRRERFLYNVSCGKAKINSGVTYPHELVRDYKYRDYDETTEEMWKALPDTVNGCSNTIVVADGSGSMCCNVGSGSTTAEDVATALAIYFSERMTGQFKDKFITFSEHPQLVDLSKCETLKEKIGLVQSYCEVANTNIKAVFEMILKAAMANKMTQDEIPANILIISDMEFDHCAMEGDQMLRSDSTLFKVIGAEYEAAGYKLPRLVFWNVNSRTGTIPVKENDLGVALVSGFSVNVAKMVMSNKLDPLECLLETINSDRYLPIEKAIKEVKVIN
jgi:hypothetical protein